MDGLALIIIILAVGYLSFVIIERVVLDKIRKSFKYIIHVNGIRGKSTTTRLIDAGIRNCGFKVFSKTTGTVPTYINVNNQDVVIKRLGKANIREQIKMLRLAKKEGAEVVVLECMAVNPELQRICEEKILKADVTVITNVRLDHVNDMGEDLDDIANAFSNTIPTNGTLVIGPGDYEKYFTDKAKLKGTNVICAKPYNGPNLDTFEENISLALGVCEALSLNQEAFYEGLKTYHHDVGAFESYQIGNTILYNGFSINDPTSINVVFDRIKKDMNLKEEEITILLNNRADRPTRVIQHIEMIQKYQIKKLILMGSNRTYVTQKIKKLRPDLEIVNYHDINDLFNDQYIFAVGNIGGQGMKILDYFKENGEEL